MLSTHTRAHQRGKKKESLPFNRGFVSVDTAESEIPFYQRTGDPVSNNTEGREDQ